MYNEEAELLERFDFDPALAGAALLGKDMGQLFAVADRDRLIGIISPHISVDSYLVRDMGFNELDRNLELLTAFRDGITAA